MPNSKTTSGTIKIVKKIQSNFRNRQKKTQKAKTIQRQFRKFRSYPTCAVCLEPITNSNKLNFYCTESNQHKIHDQCIFNFVNSFSQPYPQKISCPQCRIGNISLKFNKLVPGNQNITESQAIKKSFDNFPNRLLNASVKINDLKKSGKFKNVDLNESKINKMNNRMESILNSFSFLRNQVIDAKTLIETFKRQNNQKMLKNILDNLDYIKAFRGILEEYLDIIDNLHLSLKNKQITSSTSSQSSQSSQSSRTSKTIR